MDLLDIEELVPEEIAGLCGMVTPIVAYVFILIAIAIHPWFTWADNALSDLGAVDTAYNNIFNFGMIVSGLLGVIFALGMFREVEEKLGVLGMGIFLAGMIFLVLLGVFPSGTSPHMAISIMFFIYSGVGIILFGVDQLWDFAEPVWGIFALASVIPLLAAITIIYSIPYDLGYAIPEFLGTIPIMQFSLVFGSKLYFE